MTDQKIAYEQHPVSPDRKAELRAQGYKIIDARFKPAVKEDKVGSRKARRDQATDSGAE